MTHELQQAIEEFKSQAVENCYADDPDEPAIYTIEQIAADGNLAEGYCADVSEAFVAFLDERGIEAVTVYTHDAREWGYNRGVVHYAVRAGNVFIDWTHRQFAHPAHDPKPGDPLVRQED